MQTTYSDDMVSAAEQYQAELARLTALAAEEQWSTVDWLRATDDAWDRTLGAL